MCVIVHACPHANQYMHAAFPFTCLCCFDTEPRLITTQHGNEYLVTKAEILAFLEPQCEWWSFSVSRGILLSFLHKVSVCPL